MEELIKRLTELVEAGEKKTTLEESIGLPKNSLSAVLSGANKMPQSWIPKIEAFLAAPIADAAPEPEPLEDDPTQLEVDEEGIKERPSDERMARLDAIMAKCNKDFGAGTIMRLGDKPLKGFQAVPTGSLGLDIAIGIGGLPRGRIVEIFGPESSGKTTLAIHIIANAQKMGLKCAIVDAEHAFDPEYAKALGVDINDLMISQPDYGEQSLEVADRMILDGDIGVMVIDSVAALVPKAELEGEMGDSKMGLHARLMSQACRKMTASVSKTNTLCIFINQIRQTIGNMYVHEFTPGGNALKFFSSVRLDIRCMAVIKDGEEALGRRSKVKVIKNKVAPPFKIAEFDIIYGKGISRAGELVDIAVEHGIIKKSGSWFSHGSDKLGQGRDGVIGMIESNEAFAKQIEAEIKFTLEQ
jgi:recombination protein RecA